MGALLLEMGRTEEAFQCFMRRASLVTAPPSRRASRKDHDTEQAAFRGSVPAAVKIVDGARIESAAN